MTSTKAHLDSRDRIPLKKVLGKCKAKTFDLYWEDGRLILEPLIEIPEREMWLYENKEALASVRRGIEDSRQGKVKKLNLKKFLDE